MGRPNLFSYATSELSQDAFVCWLLESASPEYEELDIELHECVAKFIQKFNGLINIVQTVARLKKAEELLDAAAAE